MMSRLSVVECACAALLCLSAVGRAEDVAEKKVDELTAQRYKLMEDRMATVQVKSDAEGFPESFEPKPIFRYTDPARSYVAAALWKLGKEGRPRAFITTELHRQFFGRPRIVYEFLSLTPERFTATCDGFPWAPPGTEAEFKPVPKAPAPDATPERRLLQMRAIAKRFGGTELVDNEQCELRLLPQPIDRYVPSSADRADGAVFLLTFGTNPEVALLIESDGKQWTYAAGRLAGASSILLTIDGEPAWEGRPVQYGTNSCYTATNAAARIPGVADDGSEITE